MKTEEDNADDDRGSNDSSACPDSPGEVIRSTTMSDTAKYRRTAKHIRHCYMFPDEKGKHDALNMQNFNVKLWNTEAEQCLSGLYGSDSHAHWKRLTPLILERRDAVKGAQRALREMQKNESDKASLLQDPLIANTARARRLIERRDQQLAESDAKIEHMRCLLRDRSTVDTAIRPETATQFEGMQTVQYVDRNLPTSPLSSAGSFAPNTAWSTTSAAESISAVSSSSSIGDRTLPSPRPSMGRSASTTEGESDDGPRPRSSINSAVNARRGAVAQALQRTPSLGYLGSSGWGGSRRPPGSSSSDDASVGDNDNNNNEILPEPAYSTDRTSSEAAIVGRGNSQTGECSSRDLNASLVSVGLVVSNSRCSGSNSASIASAGEIDDRAGSPAIVDTIGSGTTSTPTRNATSTRTNYPTTLFRAVDRTRRPSTRSCLLPTTSGDRVNGARSTNKLRTTSAPRAVNTMRSRDPSKGVGGGHSHRKNGTHGESNSNGKEYASNEGLLSDGSSDAITPNNAHFPGRSVVGGGGGRRVASDRVRIASPETRESARVSGESSISSSGNIDSVGRLVMGEDIRARQTTSRTISDKDRVGGVDRRVEKNTGEVCDDNGIEKTDAPRAVVPEERENNTLEANAAEVHTSRSTTPSLTPSALSHQSCGREQTACRGSGAEGKHGGPSQAKRIVFLRKSLEQEHAAREVREQEVKDLEDRKKQLADELAKSQRSEQVISTKLGNLEEAHKSLMEEARRKDEVAEKLASVATRRQARAGEEIAADVQRRLTVVETERAKELVGARQRIADVEDRLARMTEDVINKAAAEENEKAAEASCSTFALRERVVEFENGKRCAGVAILPDTGAAAEAAEILTLRKTVAELEGKYTQQAQRALDARDRATSLDHEVTRLRERLAAAEEDGARATRKMQEVRAAAAATEFSLMQRLREQWETRCVHLQHESQRTVAAEERAAVAEREATQLRERLNNAEDARITAERAAEEVTATTTTKELVSDRHPNVEEQKQLKSFAAATEGKAEATKLDTVSLLESLIESEHARASAEPAAEVARAAVEEYMETAAKRQATNIREHLALKHECNETVARAARETQAAAAAEIASLQKRAVEDRDRCRVLFEKSTARKLADVRQSTKEATQKVRALTDTISTMAQREIEVEARHQRALEEMASRLKASDEQQAKTDRHIEELQDRQFALVAAKAEVTKREAALAAARVLQRSPDTLAASATAGECGPVPQKRCFQGEDGLGGRRVPFMALTSDFAPGWGRDPVLGCAELNDDAALLAGSKFRRQDHRMSTCALPSDLSGSVAGSCIARNVGEKGSHSRSHFDRWSGVQRRGKGRGGGMATATHVEGGVTYSATLRAAMATAAAAGARAGVLAGTQAAARSLEVIRGGTASVSQVSRRRNPSPSYMRRPNFE